MIRYAALAVFIAVPVLAQPDAPTTPAGKVLTAWVEMFNSADIAKVREFERVYGKPANEPARPPEAVIAFRDQTGGFRVIRFEKQEALTAVALLQEREGETIARLEITVSEADPPQIVSNQIRPVPRPADLALPRMTEMDAIAALDAKLAELAKADRFSGVFLVARDGKVLLEKTVGLADREKKTQVTADTRFRIGSMNKMFTSVATLQLVDAGKLALDDTIGKHLTDYPNRDVASKVTIRHLLTHTGGTGDIFGPEFEKNRLELQEHHDYLKLYGSRAPAYEPGAQFRYSNYGFILLGAIIERVTGMPYYDAVRKNVFAKAGMDSTDSLPETESVTHRSVGYMKRNGEWLSNTSTLPWRGTSAGGGYSTARDLLRFAQALEAGTLISKKLLTDATTEHNSGYGYGFNSREESGIRWYGHGGGAPGMNGWLRVMPKLGYVIVALSNLDPPSASRTVEFFTLRMPATRPSS